jgi:N-formylglutamate amidohydrolase
MVEVNRRLYMDEATGKKSALFENCRKRLGFIVEGLRKLQD